MGGLSDNCRTHPNCSSALRCAISARSLMSNTQLMPAPDVAHLIHSSATAVSSSTPHLAGLYGVPTKRLNEQAKRNASRSPPDLVLTLRR